ncbi:putative tetratricopeptide repeat protein 41 isoform X2 [Hyperolius riggenbachi]|uniref:putative tetratricopeptide repeat protein 41 isoform X2 n=1 Tax=Hyperolius riggenbachi TaxID=752182 RepID=UPI0035A2AC55
MPHIAEYSVTAHKGHQYYFTSRSPIRPYICSTQKDFVEERNYLAQVVFPQLEHFCFLRGTSFEAVDLKWPVEEKLYNTNHLHSDYIQYEQLKLHLDYINHSSPFFICLLGHTYGKFTSKRRIQIPINSSDWLEDEEDFIVAANGGYPWVLDECNKDCSFTELEIIQASFMKDTQFQYYYFRDYSFIEEKLQQAADQEKPYFVSTFASKDEDEELRIWNLKLKIVDKGLPVRFFKTKEELGNLILEDWCNAIEKLYPLHSTPGNIGHEQSLAQAYHEAYAESVCKDFVASQGSKKLFVLLDTFACVTLTNEQLSHTSLEDHIESSERLKSILLLHGDQGCGKSTTVAKWLSLFWKHHPDVTVIPYFVGGNGRSNDIMCFLRYCVILLQCDYFDMQIEDVYSSENISDLWDFSLLVQAFLASVALRPCVLILDAVDELSGIHGLSAEQAKGFTWLPASLPPYCKMIITTRTYHLSYKSLMLRPDVQMVAFPVLSDAGERMSILHKHLAMPSRHIAPCLLENIDNKKKKLSSLQLAVLASELRICPDLSNCIDSHLEVQSTEQLWSMVIQHWIKHYSWTYEMKKKSKIINSALANGITNTGVAMPISECLDSSFYTTVDHKRKQYHQLLLRHFQQKDLSRQVYEEVPWHLKLSGRLNELCRFLLNKRTLSLICKNMKYGCQMKMDMIQFLQILVRSGKDPAVECLMMLQSLTESGADLASWCSALCLSAECLKHVGKTADAMVILSSIEHVLTPIQSANFELLMWTHKLTGDLYQDIGSWQEASTYYAKALHDLQQLIAENLHQDDQTQKRRGHLLALKGILTARICLEQHSPMSPNLIELPQRSTAAVPYEQATVMFCQGLSKFAAGAFSESRKLLTDCLDLRYQLHGKNHIQCGEILEYLADIQSHPLTSNYSQRLNALENYKEVIQIKEDAIKNSLSPEISQHLKLSLSNTLLKSGKLLCHSDFKRSKEAVEMLKRSLDLRTGADIVDHALNFEIHFLLKELKSKHSNSKEIVLFGDEVASSSSATSQKKRSPRVHSAPSHLHSGSHYASQEALSTEYGSNTFLLGRSKMQESVTSAEKWKLKSNKELTFHQDNVTLTVSVFPISDSTDKRPHSVASIHTSVLLSRPNSVCHTTLSGPLSDVSSLVSLSRPMSKSENYKLIHKSAWYHVPGRYPTLQSPFPPKRHQIRKEV